MHNFETLKVSIIISGKLHVDNKIYNCKTDSRKDSKNELPFLNKIYPIIANKNIFINKIIKTVFVLHNIFTILTQFLLILLII